jgi:CBS domain-containing protein
MSKTVADIMTRDPLYISPEAPLRDAIKLLAEHHISGLPVVNQKGELVGVIADTDIMWQETGVVLPPYVVLLDSVIYLQNPAHYQEEIHKALGQTVEEVMSKHPITTKPDKTLKEVAKIMLEKDIHRLPAIDDEGKLVGILTRGDIVREMASNID